MKQKSSKLPKTKKRPSVAVLKKKADAIFSIFIRLRDKSRGCITCGSKENLQCGHFQSRRHNNTRFNEANCQAQCVRCNMFNQGEQYEFGKRLDELYGEGTAERLKKEAQEVKKFTILDLQDIIEYYQEQIKIMKLWEG
jgi:hypothetical protein